MNKDEAPKKENIMVCLNHKMRKSCVRHYTLSIVVALSIAAVTFVLPVSAQEAKQKIFGSPEEAMKTLAETVRAADLKGVMAIFGPEGEDIVSSGDEVADKNALDQFVKEYQEKVDFVKEKEDRFSIIIGNDSWPFAVPIVKKGEGWVFDTKSGRKEVLNRRIGRNELNAIQVCRAFVEAQREYASTDRERDGIIQYAQKIWSDPGRRNGLFWEPGEGEPPSPMGPLVADAARAGYKKKGVKPIPYHGYYFKILKGQGPNGPGGEYHYVINGHMVAGFALLAWPAEYGVSGIMAFQVNQNGTVYQKHLGPKTEELVKVMTRYNPDKTWKRAQ
jgi:hypothetical protein